MTPLIVVVGSQILMWGEDLSGGLVDHEAINKYDPVREAVILSTAKVV